MTAAAQRSEPAGASSRALLRAEEILTSLERRAHGTAYDVLGLSPEARDANICGAVSEQLAALRRWRALPDLPATLSRRIESLRARTEEAGTLLADPGQRAALDVELGVLLPNDSDFARRQAFARELRSRREQEGARGRRDAAVARSHLDLARHYLEQGDRAPAHHLLRVALLYDPFDLETRQLCAECEARLPARPNAGAVAATAAQPGADVVDVVPRLPAANAETGSIARGPLAARLRLAGSMLAAMLAATTASAAAVSVVNEPATARWEPAAASEEVASGEGQASWVGLLTAAFDAIETGDHARALALAERSQSLQPSNRAVEVITLASCGLGDAGRARTSYVKLTGAAAVSRVAAECRSRGVHLDPGLRREAALDLLLDARKASRVGSMDKACELAGESMALWPNSGTRAMLAICACHHDDVERARNLARMLAAPDWEEAATRCEELGVSLGDMPQSPEVDEAFANLATRVEEPVSQPGDTGPLQVPVQVPSEPPPAGPVYIDPDIVAPRLIRTPPARTARGGDAGDTSSPSARPAAQAEKNGHAHPRRAGH